jgi:hypothetical protein
MQELDLKVLLGTVFALNKVKLLCCLVCSSTGAVIFAPNRERERERERERTVSCLVGSTDAHVCAMRVISCLVGSTDAVSHLLQRIFFLVLLVWYGG